MGIDIISRNDDFGSAKAANAAILEAVRTGYMVRNVSCMAPAPFIEAGAEELKRFPEICVGVHLTLNSEWDGIYWGALSEAKPKALTDARGCFFRSQKELAAAQPDIETILKEYDAQLDRLTHLGLNVSYADSHMAPELWIPGLYEAQCAWIQKKGLVDSGKFYHFAQQSGPEWAETEEEFLTNVEAWLSSLPAQEQYLYVMHPAKKSDETLLMYNSDIPTGRIQKERAQEYHSVTSARWLEWKEKFDLRFLKYTEAKEQADGKEQLVKLFRKSL